MVNAPLILGIDTSCDDTGVGVTRGGAVLANVVAAQTALCARYGGVMPEAASREHLSVIDAVVQQALDAAGVTLQDIDIVAATYGPGLVGALLVGLTYAKALAWSLEKRFVPVHHLEGHIASSLAVSDGADAVSPPFLCLIASGGHTSLFEVKAWGDYAELGRSRDDAAGEAFDKVARLLGLEAAGGAALSALAATGNDATYPFTVPLRTQDGFDFSFSGLKTAVATLLQKEPDAIKADVAASFEKTVVESLRSVTLRAAEATGHSNVVVAGGVAANRRLREQFAATALQTYFPPLSLATDNGAMIALAAGHSFKMHIDWTVDAAPYLPLDTRLRDPGSRDPGLDPDLRDRASS